MSAHADLNLLNHLAALLEHRSVTTSAQSLQIGQPAMSAALAKLRRLYSDELLVRVGQHYELTPLAASLQEPVSLALELATSTLSAAPAIDRSGLSRTFSIGCTEYELTVLGARIMARLRAEAPNVKVHFDVMGSEDLDQLAARLRRQDCMITQSGWLPGYPSLRLFTDTLCLAVSAGNDDVHDPVGADDLSDLHWSSITASPLLLTMIGRMLTLPVLADKVVATVDNVIGQMAMLAGTDLVCPAPRRLVDTLGAAYGVRPVTIKDIPGKIGVDLVWHPARQRDWGLALFRDVVSRAAQGLDDQEPAKQRTE